MTWDLHSHKLVWVVEKGTPQDGEFVPTSQERYEISPGEAMMAVGGEQRGFTEQEAAWLQRLLNVLTIYCAESVVWWNSGEAAPANPPTPSAEPPATPEDKPAEAPDTVVHKVSLPLSKMPAAAAHVEIAKKGKQ